MKISVVVPTLNERENLPRLLESLRPQLKSGDEVIVVDAGSTNGTVAVAQSYGCKVIVEPGCSIGRARQIGALNASNPIVFSTDADVVLPMNHLSKIRSHFMEGGLVAVSGPVYDVKNRLISKVGEATLSLLKFGAGCNTAFARDAFLKTEGYPDTSRGEDVVFWNRISKVGRAVFDREMPVYMDTEGFNWQTVPVLALSAATVGSGVVLRHLRRKIVGDAFLGAGVGMAFSQLAWELSGHRSIGVIKCVDEECVVEKHVHHSAIGALLLLATPFLEALPLKEDAKEEIISAVAGFSFGICLHGLLTQPRSAAGRRVLRLRT